MMGSLRNPAGWNSLYSLRPTVEWMAEEVELAHNDADDRQVKMPWPMSTIGPMGRCPEDLVMLLQTMMPAERTELFDAKSVLNQSSEQLSQIVEGKTIGWLADWAGAYPMDAGLLEQCRESLD
eukprot:scaffold669_cov69-Skeletonema_menzelii.AAC.1